MSIEERIKELEATANSILSAQSHWKSCQDGSYEMALSHAGFYRIWDEIKELKKQLVEN